jgi:osmotically-inducible protein OsmY
MNELNGQSWSRPGLVNVIVRNGAVELWGIVESDLQRQAVRVAAESTAGVKSVSDNLIVRPFTGEG